MYSITKAGDKVHSICIREFIVDTLNEIQELPHIKTEGVQQGEVLASNNCVLAGSTCFCIENSSVWILGNDDVWHEM